MSDTVGINFGEGVRYEISGLRKTLRAMEQTGVAASDLKAPLYDAAMLVARAVRPPVLTGNLFMTIRPAATKRSASVRAGRKSVPYAGPIHYGWPRRNIRPQPFLTDALSAKQSQALRILDEGIAEIIRENNTTLSS